MPKFLFLTSCIKEKVSEFETFTKKVFLGTSTSDESRPRLFFLHQGVLPHEVAEKTKEKKPERLIFDEGFPKNLIPEIMKAVKKRMNGTSPSFFHVSKYGESTEALTVVRDYETLQTLN